jgi:pimeloyl-ACP methyl ester carboxylesterase
LGTRAPTTGLRLAVCDAIRGEWRTKFRPEALIFADRHLLKGWTVMDRLGEITAPTLVMAGRDDFVFPPEHQRELAAGIPHARLQIIERAGHNPHSEQPVGRQTLHLRGRAGSLIRRPAAEAPTVGR